MVRVSRFMARTARSLRRPASWAIPLALLVVALATRAVGLGSFSWPDELTWLQRGAAFVTALERGDLPDTYLTDHPGVVPMWGFGGALYLRTLLTGDRAAFDALAAVAREADAPPDIPSAQIPALLATAAWFTVAVTSLAVVAAYLLLVPLLGRGGAALAGLFLALDPFFLAQSRIVHVDGLLASFMLLSMLSLLVYLKRPGRRRYLFLSGVMAGLAMLTKTPSLFLIPLTLLALGVQWLWQRRQKPAGGWGRLRQAAVAFALWLATMYATFLALWPAAWLRPLFLTYRLYRASRWGTIVSHGSNFFLGQPVDDPGPLFYWVVLPFRLSPLALILLLVGLALVVLAVRAALRRAAAPRGPCEGDGGDVRLPVVALAFVVFFTIMVSLAAKKGDRYLLPAFLPADVLAAWVLVELIERARALARRWGKGPARSWLLAGGAALILATSVLWLRLAPYYGAYFNPLLGGGPVAVRTFAFGQGEGLDLAARYLNGREDSRDLLAVSFYPQEFRYYFDGNATSLRRGDWDKTWQFADYVVFYVSQVQRKLPTAGLVDFFSGLRPEYTARLGGVDFASVYRSPVLLSGQPPAVERALEGARLGDSLRLAGYALGADRPAPGQDLDVALYWLPEAQLGADYDLTVRL
ncbi:MAG: glycosyltransferase family 39 protein, partial [Anaerolineae bacterium]|nr:glycosyltransferase family 39 protein [Anaerolineae bacterium]